MFTFGCKVKTQSISEIILEVKYPVLFITESLFICCGLEGLYLDFDIRYVVWRTFFFYLVCTIHVSFEVQAGETAQNQPKYCSCIQSLHEPTQIKLFRGWNGSDRLVPTPRED